ncbi:MAG: hypothetical protein OEY11_04740 [Gammaproteobacteria bacterium]|nr:hypothetical protein [Gammaproteobacteria bacterium]
MHRHTLLFIAHFELTNVTMTRQLKDALLATIGFLLSPLSWWNDAFINLPLAYVFSLPFSLINEQLFLPMLLFGYWVSNLLGLLMLHRGGENLISKTRPVISLRRSLVISLLYSVTVSALVLLDWLAPPTELFALLDKG